MGSGTVNLFIYYPKCSTCQKVKAFLDENKIAYQDRDIKLEKPSKKELKDWSVKFNIPVRRFFNTSGILYRELGLKEKLHFMSDEEQFELLASDGMLVKRPIFISSDFLIIGNSKKEYEALL